MSHKPSFKPSALAVALLSAGLLTSVQPAQALNQFLKTWQDTYPNSTTDDASCNVCHGTSNSNLNSYGKSLCDAFEGSLPADIAPGLIVIEGLDSDSDPTDSSNRDEIDADAQPGWTTGAVNQLYAADVGGGCLAVGGPINVPATVPLPYEPPTGGDPVADADGPYTGNVNVPVTFDGSGSYDSDETDVIDLYVWDFGDGSDPVETTEPTIEHTYTAANSYIVNLTVTDDDGVSNTNSTLATISGAAVLDLDIAAFKVAKTASLGKPISIQLSVENPGTVLGQAPATVVGMQNGAQVYSWTLNVYDYNGKSATSFTFPSYKATTKGTISWAVTIKDVDPDSDLATATTTVK